MTIDSLLSDSSAVFFSTPAVDSAYYTGIKLVGVYYDVDDRIITEFPDGTIRIYKLYHTNKGTYFNCYKRRMYIDKFLT